MHIREVRPLVVSTAAVLDRCANCEARPFSVCAAIDDGDLRQLAAAAVIRSVAAGETVLQEGDAAQDFFNITHGTAKLYKLLPDGRQQITGFAGTGHFLGLAHSTSYAFSAEAIEPMQMCRFSRPKLRALIADFPALEARLLETACNELAAAQEQMLLLGRKTARERLASFLLMRSRQAAPCCHSATVIRLPMTRGEIADYLGLTTETVSRVFTQFRKAKRIATPSSTEVVVLDQEWLEDLAAGLA
jgi:CRP/FNR family transcriptional regulator